MNGANKMTVETYDRSAKAIAKHMASNGSRLGLVKEALRLLGNQKDARVVEVGCGDGRDAAGIVPLVGWYEGFDPSIGLIKLARARHLGVSFAQADALSYDYPSGLDMVIALASLLHIDRSDFTLACSKIAASLRPGGLIVMTLRERENYSQVMEEGTFGKRMFYYYDESTVRACLRGNFQVVQLRHAPDARRPYQWLHVIACKIA